MTWHIQYRPDTRDHSKANYKGVDKWMEANQGKHKCQCGCGEHIIIKPHMHCRSFGIAKYLPFHYMRTAEYLIANVERAKARTGTKAAHYQGGKTKKQALLRNSKLYVEWRTRVYERDNYTCQHCGAHSEKGRKVYLHAHHHKLPFRKLWDEFVEGKRTKDSLFDPELGITLCKSCHRSIHFKSSAKLQGA